MHRLWRCRRIIHEFKKGLVEDGWKLVAALTSIDNTQRMIIIIMVSFDSSFDDGKTASNVHKDFGRDAPAEFHLGTPAEP
jgi:hypothetical protein